MRLSIDIDGFTGEKTQAVSGAANFPTNIMDFRGFDSSIMLSLRSGIPRPTGDSPESLTQAMFVGAMLVGGLGVRCSATDASLVVGPAIDHGLGGCEHSRIGYIVLYFIRSYYVLLHHIIL